MELEEALLTYMGENDPKILKQNFLTKINLSLKNLLILMNI